MHDAKKMILTYLSEASINYVENKINKCDTYTISDYLFLSRSTTSNYLNSLVESKELIKIKSRPVIYLHKEALENAYQIGFEANISEFEDEDMFLEFLNCQISKKHNFENEIGFNTSLKYVVRQCISSIKYPPFGLPLLLVGAKGTGKKLLSQHIYEYLVDTKKFKKDDPYYIFNCNLENDHLQKLFGYYDHDKFHIGFLGKIKKAVIFINHSESLDPLAKEKFKYAIQNDKNSFGLPYSISPEIRFIFACDCDLQYDWKNDPLYQLIPIQVEIPSLDERYPEDKKQLIYKYIRRETKSFNKDVEISIALLDFLMNTKYERNIDELKLIIKTCCANAYTDSDLNDPTFKLCLHNLPDCYLANATRLVNNYDRHNFIELDKINMQYEFRKLSHYYDKILSLYEKYHFAGTDNFYNDGFNLMNEYFDFVIFNNEYADKRIKALESSIKKIIEIIYSRYKITLPTNFTFVVARVVYFQLYYKEDFSNWEYTNKNIEELYNNVITAFEKETGIVKELSALITQNLDVTLDKVTRIFLIFYVSLFNKNPQRKHIASIILSHGYSTASSIADTCNRFLNHHIFDSIDMPLNTSVSDIANMLSNYFYNNYIGNEVILLVDMGSLENIGNLLKNITNIKLGIINNISTKIALNIGEKIMSNIPMEEILSSTCKETTVNYKIIQQQTKEKAILFTTETGVITTERMVQLFKKSIPNALNISTIPYDYYKLSKNKKADPIFEQFHILFVIGTMPIDIPQVPYVSLEDIINLDNTTEVNKIFSSIFNESELIEFNSNLIKYFSMESVLNYITILNPDVLLNFVVKAVNRLESKMCIKYSNKQRIGMYIHICCLIERLVTKASIADYQDIDCFINRHQNFIKDVEECFSEISIHYNVKIPIVEIAYLYNYVKNS